MSEKELNMLIAKRIQEYLNMYGKTQADLADYMNVTQATVSNWCNGKKIPRMDKIDKICSFFNINRSDLMVEDPQAKPRFVRVPVIGMVHAGLPGDIIPDPVGWEDIDVNTAMRGDITALEVKGDSMEPRIKAGDVIIVRYQPDCENGDLCIVAVNGEEKALKFVKKYDNGSIALIAMNPAYPPMVFTPEEIQSLPVTVIGKVLELRGKF